MATQAKTKINYREQHQALKREAAEKLLNTPVQEGEKTYPVPTPGLTFECRRPNLKLFSDAGLLPANLASKLYLASQSGSSDIGMAIKGLSIREKAQAIEFNASLVRYIAVLPRIVETPESDDEIAFDDVTQGEFDALTQWAISGGEQAARLETFPGGRQSNVAVGTNGKGKAPSSK